jgi:hypothetical protein
MVNTSKVLTVSYGTFSCTLEGFDDSFDTMKAIAEYFRDLAADDRYFGAEPPTPDAEMLAKIAEREVSRRVEAHSEGGNIVLRTALPDAELPEAEVAPTAVALLNKDADTVDAKQTEQDALAEEKRVADEAAARVAQRAARRAARAAEEQAAKDAAEAAEKEAADQAARDAEQAANAELEAKAQAEADEKANAARLAKEQAEEAAQAEAEALIEAEAKRKANEDAAKLARDDLDDASQDEPDSIAAKLARIRAVVGKPSSAPLATDFSEDEHAGDIMQGREDDTDLEDILDMGADADLEDAIQETNTTPAVEDTISGVMSRLAEDTPETESAQEPEVAIQPEPEPVVAEVVAPKAPIRARVIKMKREEFEAAIASGDIEEDADEAIEETSLSVDDEAELARELAAVEAELSELPDEVSNSEPVAEPLILETLDLDKTSLYEENDVQSARGVDDLAVAPDVEMDRLMVQASTKLDEPDGKKRRNALGHLRAAVASARADKKIGSNATPVDETEEYRADLDTVVQPSRPVRRLSSSDTPVATARPPLKLVEEQRVDATISAPEPVASQTPTPQPVRPRRIKVGDMAAQASSAEVFDAAPEGGTFNEFAEEMGATELPDLLEAAAAYLAYVEGKDQFSRPQLMTKVRMVQEENFSREDGLRSFGQLLRQGKIEKISGGRFTVSDRISFKPDTRAAG